jgi:solute:Na+ symporter, SSS family
MSFANAHLADVIVIAIYLATTFIIGVLAHRALRSGGEDEEGYYLAGRRVPAWVNGVSYAATAINADVAPLYCGIAAVVGLPVAWFYISRFGLAWMLVAMLFAVRWRQLGIQTGPEFYALRFGGRGATFVRVYTALFAIAIGMIPWIGAGLLGAHKIMQPVLGVDSKLVTLAVITPLVAIYVLVSGFAGVLLTDVFQSFVIVAASAVLLGAVLTDFGGPTALGAAIEANHSVEHAEILSVLPVPGHEVLGPMAALLWLVVPTIGRGGNVDLDGQRIFSCRNAREAAKMPIWGQAVMFLMLLLITLPVLGMLAKRPELYHSPRAEREHVYGLLLTEYLPAGFLGFVIAGVLASVMSTISGYLNYGSQTFVNDVLRPLFPGASWLDHRHPRCLWIGRMATIGILACGIGVMCAADSLFRIAVIINGMFAASASFYWAQWWWWRVNFSSWIAAMVGGPAVFILLSWLLPHWSWWQDQAALSETAADVMLMLQAFITIAATTLLWFVTALLTTPEHDATLLRFYLRARPLGFWGPVKRMVDRMPEAPISNRADPPGMLTGGVVAAVVGASWIALSALGLSQLVVGQWLVAAGLLLASIVLAVMFRRLFHWHLNRLGAESA